jgi:uncharacterized protein (TIGR00255 family)
VTVPKGTPAGIEPICLRFEIIMAASMTGYARVKSEGEDLSLTLTVRSVNHRFLDLQLRVPPEIEALESLIRQHIKQQITRGQLQISASLRWHRRAERLRVNRPLVEAYLESYRELAQEQGIAAEPDLNAVFRIPGAVTLDETELEEPQKSLLHDALKDCLTRATEELLQNRLREGAGIVADIRERDRAVQQEVARLTAMLPDATAKFQQRIERRLADLLGEVPLDPQRALQEAAILADRTDISEELQRLKAHAERLLEMLAGGGELGKQIDFLAQEMNRETNTMLSKTTPLGHEGLEFTDAALRIKAEIEKIREQAQNLE